MLVIVGFMVTATGGLPAREQGTAAGLATMAPQIGIAIARLRPRRPPAWPGCGVPGPPLAGRW